MTTNIAGLDENSRNVIKAISSVDGTSIVNVYADPVTHRLLVDASSSPLTTKGDIFTYSTTNDRLPVGPNGYVLSADSTQVTGLKWIVAGTGTVTSVAALTLGTTGTDLSSTVATGTTTPVITLNVPTASGTNRGALSSTDWTTFNNKQNAISFGTGVQTALGVNIGSAGAPVLYNGAGGTPSSLTLTNATGLPAASVVAGALGTGAYTMDTKLTVPQVINTNNAITASGNAATVPVTYKINTVTNNSAATLTITMTTTSATDGQISIVRILDFSAVAQTLTFVNTENSTVSVPTTSNGSTTLPLTVGFQYNNATSKWRCISYA